MLAAARAKSHNIAEATRKAVDDEIAVEVEAAEVDFANKQALADANISKIRSAALSKIDAVAIETAAAVVEKIGNIKPTASQVKSAILAAKG